MFNTKTDLQKYLLSKYNFIQNEYFSQYLDLILNYDKTTVGYRELHHILPVMHYKNIENTTRNKALKLANNDKNNYTIYLLYKDHCYAHYLLYFCTIGKIKEGNAVAVQFITKMYYTLTKIKKVNFNIDDFNILQKYLDRISSDNDSNLWSSSDIMFLFNNYEIKGESYCAKKLNRTKSAIRSKASKLGLKMLKWWTKEDELFLIKNLDKLGIEKCAQILNRDITTVQNKIYRLNLAEQNNYSEKEIIFLKENYSIKGPEYCARALNRTYDAIKRKAALLGLNCSQGMPIYCLEINKIFESISDAAKQLNLSDGNICSVLKGRIKSTKGYHFEYISKEVYYKEKDNEKR